jgi:hypothetical protein
MPYRSGGALGDSRPAGPGALLYRSEEPRCSKGLGGGGLFSYRVEGAGAYELDEEDCLLPPFCSGSANLGSSSGLYGLLYAMVASE